MTPVDIPVFRLSKSISTKFKNKRISKYISIAIIRPTAGYKISIEILKKTDLIVISNRKLRREHFEYSRGD